MNLGAGVLAPLGTEESKEGKSNDFRSVQQTKLVSQWAWSELNPRLNWNDQPNLWLKASNPAWNSCHLWDEDKGRGYGVSKLRCKVFLFHGTGKQTQIFEGWLQVCYRYPIALNEKPKSCVSLWQTGKKAMAVSESEEYLNCFSVRLLLRPQEGFFSFQKPL